MRWRIAILVSAAIAISYLDRQTLPVAIKAIERDIPITNEQFSLLQTAFLIAYAVMYAGGGKLMDVVGTRAGHRWRSWCSGRSPAPATAWRPASACSPSAASCSAWAKAAASRPRPGPSPSGSRSPSARRRWASSTPAPRSAASSRRRCWRSIITGADWRAVFYLTGAIGLAWAGVVVVRATTRPTGIRSSATPSGDCSQPVIAGGRDRRCGAAVAGAAAVPRGLGPRRRQVPERRGLVFLPVLAAEIPLRRARLRHQGGRRVRLDPATPPPGSAACSAGGSRATCWCAACRSIAPARSRSA